MTTELHHHHLDDSDALQSIVHSDDFDGDDSIELASLSMSTSGARRNSKEDALLPESTAPEDSKVNLCVWGNIAIPAFYFVLGLLLKFPYIALRQYCRLELKLPPASQTLILGVIMYTLGALRYVILI